MAIGDPLLVAIGGVVGASGLLLTQIMCRAMNRHLGDILLGKTSAPTKREKAEPAAVVKEAQAAPSGQAACEKESPAEILRQAKNVIIVPGYGMALAQAQQTVKQLADRLEARGAQVRFAIHPVAGRMPGHMNVLLCEADVPYEQLYEMDAINDGFKACDAVLVIGANDVVNPAANTAEGTPIYGMPVLSVDQAKHVIICNYDLKTRICGRGKPALPQAGRIAPARRRTGDAAIIAHKGIGNGNGLQTVRFVAAKRGEKYRSGKGRPPRSRFAAQGDGLFPGWMREVMWVYSA